MITALEQSELLGASELDELAEALLIHEHVVSYPLASTSPEWLKIEIELDDGTGDTGKVSEDMVAHHRRGVEPPLRRWAARRALGADPDRLEQLLDGADLFDARHRDAVIHGLIDAADVLDEPQRRTVLGRGLDGGQSSVRLAALDLLCELDGLDAARGRADQDRNATVRKWTPPSELTHPTLL